jgi:hypothetical protein
MKCRKRRESISGTKRLFKQKREGESFRAFLICRQRDAGLFQNAIENVCRRSTNWKGPIGAFVGKDINHAALKTNHKIQGHTILHGTDSVAGIETVSLHTASGNAIAERRYQIGPFCCLSHFDLAED